MAGSLKLSLVVPTFNERDNLAALIERVHQSLSEHPYELIVVDDASPDGTGDLALEYAARYPIRVISRVTGRGLASAVVEGFKQARAEVLGVMDADLQHPPETLPALLQEIDQEADLVIASRYVREGGIRGWSLQRRIISQGAILLAKLVVRSARRVGDPLSGFFLLKRHVIGRSKLEPTGYKILLEILVKGNYQRVVEVPYWFVERARGKSKLNLKQELAYLHHLYRLVRVQGELSRETPAKPSPPSSG
jgi:dolichol-phosphate mannosyltransferase